MKFAKKFNISVGAKRLPKEDKEDVMKNKDKFITAIARKMSFAKAFYFCDSKRSHCARETQ